MAGYIFIASASAVTTIPFQRTPTRIQGERILMDSITVRCKMCKHAMKFSSEKAGKRAKCSKCDTVLVIEPAQQNDADENVAVAVEEPKPAVQEEDDVGAYEVFTDPELLA